ncbi:L-aspartate oxidase [Rhizobium sp. BK181]|uniref:FAD-binding protein n=1 Tax=Rhizobium sp. BK181 TaxID=2587072 RepID=UPI00161ECC4F|nr:FAD-binding protein [Rhizobium sp. BK181]MBB3317591.1 L-aspartate oxidase [Rhizobium sp. BK181]
MKDQFQEIRTDVLVVGSGAAALRAILDADSAGAEVLVVIKGEFRKSGATYHSVAEVGAFNVPDNAGDVDDSPDAFLDDILTAAQGMADPRLSRVLADEAEEALRYLADHGVHFERQDDRYLVFQACFSSRPRSHVIKDHFKPIVKALGGEASRRGIKVLDNLMITNLIVGDGQCLGAYAIDAAGMPVVIRAKSTILTTGGASQLFATNLYPSDITGDGYAMAHRAGAHLANMEFMQAGISIVSPFINLFGNYLWNAHPNLTDREAKPFVRDYLPRDLTIDAVIDEKQRHFPFSSSDISKYIEISVQKAINEGRAANEGGVFLDFLDTDFGKVLADPSQSIARMWPMTYDWYKEKGVDLYRDKVQIACSAHAINGGILIDENAQSSLPGLFAAGEVAAGPHGADRLGGNMAVTCQVFGGRAGRAAADRAARTGHAEIAGLLEAERAFRDTFCGKGTTSLSAIREELQRAANRHLLIIRTAEGLETLSGTCDALRGELQSNAAIEGPADRRAAIEIGNLLDVCDMMILAASARKESRGSHYREDFPLRSEAEKTSIILDGASREGYFRISLAER